MKPVQWLKTTAILVLGVFYLGLCYAVAHPQVSPEYRIHYIERRVDCWLSEAQAALGRELPRNIALGGMAYRDSCLFLRAGWLVPAPTVAWSRPGTSTLRIPWRDDAAAIQLGLRAASGPAPIGVHLTVGAVETAVEVPPGGSAAVTLDLPPSPDRRAWEITVRSVGTGTIERPGPVPTQLVGIGLERITYLDAP